MNGILKFEHIRKSFGGNVVLDDFNLAVAPGERIAVIGPSGCGKSLFLRLAEGLEKPDSGRILVAGAELTARGADPDRIRRKMGMVHQGYHLFEHLNVLDNLTLAPRKLKNTPRREAEKQARDLLHMVGLESRQYDMPEVLSGGQKQRAAIARALAMEPEIMLFDEPTSALDPSMTGEVLATLRMLAKRRLTMVIVTHEMDFAREVATRVVYFDRGGIHEEGTPEEIFDHPKTPELQRFIRRLKFFSAHIESRDFDLMRLHGGIRDFAERYGISHKAAYRLQLCAEELIFEMILGCFASGGEALDLDVEYSETDHTVLLRCACASDRFNPFDAPENDDTHLGLKILRSAARKIDFAYDGNVNRLEITL